MTETNVYNATLVHTDLELSLVYISNNMNKNISKNSNSAFSTHIFFSLDEITYIMQHYLNCIYTNIMKTIYVPNCLLNLVSL